MANLPIEIKFAQSLAGNEKKTRDKAVRKLREYFAAKSASKKDGFTEVDFLKIWKGLHYCMWMQDKPLIQEELSASICGLLHHLQKVEAQLLFIRTYFITEAREWNTIDKWRIDKFMMLYRDMLHESLELGHRRDWESGFLQGLVSVYKDTVMNPENEKIPDGFRIHMADIYLDEVTKVGGVELDGKQLLVLLEPFIWHLQKTPNPVLLKRVVKSVFEPIIQQATEKVKASQRDDGEEEEEDEEEETRLNFDLKLLADHLFSIGQDNSKILVRNRPIMFDLVKRLQDVDAGVIPVEEKIEITPGVTDRDISKSATELARMMVSDRMSKAEKNVKMEKRKRKKNKKKGGNQSVEGKENQSEEHNNITPDTGVQLEDSPAGGNTKGDRKRKLVSKTEDSDEPLTKLKKKPENDNPLQADPSSAAELSIGKNKKKDKMSALKLNSKLKKDKHKKVKKLKKGQNVDNEPKSVSDSGTTEEKKQITTPGCSSWSVSVTPVEKDTSETEVNVSVKKKDKKSKKHAKLVIEAENGKVKDTKHKDNAVRIPQEAEKVTVKAVNKHDKKSKKHAEQQDELNMDVVQTVTKKNKKSKKGDKQDSLENVAEKDKESKNLDVETSKDSPIASKKSLPDSVTVSDNSKAEKPSDDLQDGEIEIWVPNKKYKGSKSATPKSTFASFDGSKQPVAFVKKALQKVANKTPKSAGLVLESGQSGSGSAKSVCFNMKKNKSQSFKDSLNSPRTPFNPEKKPDQGILKTPRSNSCTPKSSRVATPVTRLLSTPTNPSPLARDTRTHLTPGPQSQKLLTNVSHSAGTGVKRSVAEKKTPVKRARAADFFML